MEEQQVYTRPPLTEKQFYHTAHNLFANYDKNSYEVRMSLIKQGASEESANQIIEKVLQDITHAQKSRANKDIIYGALWLTGGLVLTLSDIGFIFWGAILFGAIQFIRGIINAVSL